jgi:hypothetical protein
VQAKYEIVNSDHGTLANDLRRLVGETEVGGKSFETPSVGHELFKIGTLTDKVPQFHLLASGNPRPETTRISPLYQITVDAKLVEEAVAGD